MIRMLDADESTINSVSAYTEFAANKQNTKKADNFTKLVLVVIIIVRRVNRLKSSTFKCNYPLKHDNCKAIIVAYLMYPPNYNSFIVSPYLPFFEHY